MDNKMDFVDKDFSWRYTQSLSDEEILELSNNVISTPTFLIASEEGDEKAKNLYSLDKMLEMFRLGFRASVDSELWPKGSKNRHLSRKKPYTIMRNLDVGETVRFSYKHWSAVRSAASQIKKNFGSEFKTRKLATSGQIGDIEVERIE